MGEYADAWGAFKKAADEHDKADKLGKAKIEPKLGELVKKLQSLKPNDAADAAAQKEHDNWDASGKVPKPVVKVEPKTGPDLLKEIDTAIKGSNPPPKGGSSKGSSGI
jgi:hypothetical protein